MPVWLREYGWAVFVPPVWTRCSSRARRHLRHPDQDTPPPTSPHAVIDQVISQMIYVMFFFFVFYARKRHDAGRSPTSVRVFPKSLRDGFFFSCPIRGGPLAIDFFYCSESEPMAVWTRLLSAYTGSVRCNLKRLMSRYLRAIILYQGMGDGNGRSSVGPSSLISGEAPVCC